MQNTRRTATVVCSEDCEFLVVDKEDFMENKLNEQMEEELNKRYDVFRCVCVVCVCVLWVCRGWVCVRERARYVYTCFINFSQLLPLCNRKWSPLYHWSDDEVMNLSYISRLEEFKHNRVVVKDSRKNEWLWFIIKVRRGQPKYYNIITGIKLIPHLRVIIP